MKKDKFVNNKLHFIKGIILFEKLIKNISQDWSVLDKNELKSYVLSGFIFLELIGVAISLFLFLILNLPVSFVIYVIIGFTISSILESIIVYNRDYLDEKYGLFYNEYKGISYQGLILFFIPISIAFAFIIFPLAVHQGGICSAISFSLAALYPAFFMFLRINVYKNENSRELVTENENGNKITEKVIGYHPVIYYIFGSLISCHIIGFSLMKVIISFIGNNLDLIYFIYLICSLLIVSFILSPDIANKLLPFELKRINGLKKFLIIGIMMMAIMGLLFVSW